jgi:8-oxo-dGTP pyrophosphatase MutT (NUDIX family)
MEVIADFLIYSRADAGTIMKFPGSLFEFQDELLFMDLSLLQEKNAFPRFVSEKLNAIYVDYKEKIMQIEKANQQGAPNLKAGVVLLLNYKKIQDKDEYVFQLIKRSARVSQSGDISCPGGMQHPKLDNFLSFLLSMGVVPSIRYSLKKYKNHKDKEIIFLTNLFLSTALREAWEEIGLNPLNIVFLGALPSCSLNLLARTIFPVVCLIEKPYLYRPSPEVDKIIEIPVRNFFQQSNYALVEIRNSEHDQNEYLKWQLPCFVITDDNGKEDILWGATFNIIYNFLRIISDNSLPSLTPSRVISKVLSKNYIPKKT